MRRRALLSAVATAGVGSLAGCQSISSSRPTPEVESVSILAEDRQCSQSPTQSATVSIDSGDDHTVLVDGTIRVPRIRDRVFADAQNGIGDQERGKADIEVHVDFAPSDPQANTDVPECEGQIAYRAEIDLSQPPRDVIVRHVVEENGSAKLETITTHSAEQ